MDHVSESAIEICRICKLKLRRKNYKTHLKNVHPKSNSEDLSGWSQPKITSLFPQGIAARIEVQEGPDQEESVVTEIDQVQNKSAQDSRKRKAESVEEDSAGRSRKRVESGDSGFGDPTPADISLNDHNDLGSKKTNVDEAETSAAIILSKTTKKIAIKQ